ncbi:MAG: FtsX-like permease family protein, partial [Bacteroidota bacterium]
YHSQYDRIYRVLHKYASDAEVPENKLLPASDLQVWGNAPAAQALKNFYPQIEHVFRFTSDFSYLVDYNGRKFQEKGIPFGDSTFHRVFDWEWIAGNPTTALVRPYTIILSKRMAEKYFGDENPIGKVMELDSQDDYEVTGVYEIPPNSHFNFQAFVSMSTFQSFRQEIFDSWQYVDFYTYFTVGENTSISAMEARIPDFLQTIDDDDMDWYTLRFEPLSEAYLYSQARRPPGPIGNEDNIFIFISVAAFVLLIACINFMNLSTARSMERAKEVAIRKTIGSGRGSLIVQFLVESLLLTFLSTVIGLLLVWIGHEHLERLVGKQLPAGWLFTVGNVAMGFVLVLLLGTIAGAYPAFVLSKFKAVKVLKGAFKSSKDGVWLRQSLVILQFALSIVLIVGTSVVFNQLQYLRQYDKGFDNDQILVIDFGWDDKVQRKLETVKAELGRHGAVVSVTASRATPGDFFPNGGTAIKDENGEWIWTSPAIYEVDEDFVSTYGMEMAAGRHYSHDHPADTAHSLVINEALAREFGYTNPSDIIGKDFQQWGREGKVIGVIKDFNYVSLHSDVEPLALRYSNWYSTSMLSIRLQSDDYVQTLAELEDIWMTVAPHRPFFAHFSSDNFNQQYETDARFGNVFSIFSGLAIFVACLGLFGLTIYSTTQRQKEIGVRKVLGASMQSLVAMLSKDFIKLFLIAMVFAVPIAWYAMNTWLDGFAYRIDMSWQVFVLAAVGTLMVSLLTMSFKTVSAALANPVESLRDE